MTVLNPAQNFASLSLTDLLEAREVFHIHLMNKANVVGTAVGRYLIRKAEQWPTKNAPVAPKITTPASAQRISLHVRTSNEILKNIKGYGHVRDLAGIHSIV